MSTENKDFKDPESIIQAAIFHELTENPYCPIPSLLNELMFLYRQGDSSALEMALQIANESLAPQKPNLFEKLKKRFRK